MLVQHTVAIYVTAVICKVETVEDSSKDLRKVCQKSSGCQVGSCQTVCIFISAIKPHELDELLIHTCILYIFRNGVRVVAFFKVILLNSASPFTA